MAIRVLRPIASEPANDDLRALVEALSARVAALELALGSANRTVAAQAAKLDEQAVQIVAIEARAPLDVASLKAEIVEACAARPVMEWEFLMERDERGLLRKVHAVPVGAAPEATDHAANLYG